MDKQKRKKKEKDPIYKIRLWKHRFRIAKVWKGYYKDIKTQENGELAQVRLVSSGKTNGNKVLRNKLRLKIRSS